jgi:hypothetical protein
MIGCTMQRLAAVVADMNSHRWMKSGFLLSFILISMTRGMSQPIASASFHTASPEHYPSDSINLVPAKPKIDVVCSDGNGSMCHQLVNHSRVGVTLAASFTGKAAGAIPCNAVHCSGSSPTLLSIAVPQAVDRFVDKSYVL